MNAPTVRMIHGADVVGQNSPFAEKPPVLLNIGARDLVEASTSMWLYCLYYATIRRLFA